MNRQKELVNPAPSAIDNLRKTALQAAQEAKETAKAARIKTEELEKEAEEIAREVVRVFDALAEKAAVQIDRCVAAITALREHKEIIQGSTKPPNHTIEDTAASNDALRAIEHVLTPSPLSPPDRALR